eukprot:CAMPEP_0183304452 /NCGR_PEP_ID=MMETSP0160_2-20130417/9540_1 /TAXON_ID=2839 ORGANISM="Odontella Sinensis, Strain Grunow 1884" /NCGR_SAMPLE_ID=MMETSP0160_2 /ASSEMBLY_ACC=CAM_ASM_000250 /LENGTH=106 /DNA_ID=CAMNT_0025467509 /DNA_START=111 /DNA_END=431 /DNA_ORIENTATION=-
MSQETIVGETVVGVGTFLSEKHILKWVVQDFAALDQKPGESLELPPMRCHGHLWSLVLYPRGNADTEEDGGWVSVYLKLKQASKKVCPTGKMKAICNLSAGRETDC